MIYTSYFANVDKIKAKAPWLVLVSIAGKTPDEFDGKKLKELMPKHDWWKEWHDKYSNDETGCGIDFYKQKYYETVLNATEPEEVAAKLKELADGKDVCLLCYEVPEKFCHRHLVAEWLQNAGIACVEWDEDGFKHNWSHDRKDLECCKKFISSLQRIKGITNVNQLSSYDIEDMADAIKTMSDTLYDIENKAWMTMADIAR